MFGWLNLKKGKTLYRAASFILAVVFTLTFAVAPAPVYAQPVSVLNLPVPGAKIDPSPAFAPILLKGLTINPDQPLMFDFIVDNGDAEPAEKTLRTESEQMVKYFLAALTVPSGDLWVNLSPYEEGRIIPDELGKTELGRDMLAQDYLLKQLTASLIDPQKDLGKSFWDRVYQKVQDKYGTTENIPVNTFNKVWILPEKATVYENGNAAYVVESRLKVMLDEDYLALNKNTAIKLGSADKEQVNSLSADIVRETIIPEIQKEVNAGQNFAKLRQIYHALILAKWYKETLKSSLMAQVYFNQNKIVGVDSDDKEIKDKIYDQYLAAYKKGVFNYIKEDYDRLSGETIPRKYFSGGLERFGQFELGRTSDRAALTAALPRERNRASMVRFQADPVDRAMLSYNAKNFQEETIVLDAIRQVRQYRETAEFDAARNEAITNTGASLIPKVFIVGAANEKETYGAIYSPDEERIYVQAALASRMKSSSTNLATRVFIRLFAEGSERDKRKAEYEYAKNLFPEAVNALLPAYRANGTTFDVILEKIRANVIGVDQTSIDTLRSQLGLDDNVRVAVDTNGIFQANARKLQEIGELALYTIALNALNGDIDLNRHFRIEAADTRASSPTIRAGMLAFAANPLTDAHYLIAALQAMAKSRVDTFFVSPTKGDFRKPALEATYEKRLELARTFFEDATGGLIRVMPALPEEQGNGNGVNGEEKVLSLLRLNADARNVTFFYGAGADHYFSFYRTTDGKVRFDKIITGEKEGEENKSNKKDFEYYVRLKAYPVLLRLLLRNEASNIPAERYDFLKKLSETEDPAARVAMVQDGAFFPVLDVIGKLYLIQREVEFDPALRNKFVEISMLNTSRGDQPVDVLRDALNVTTLFNQGVDFEIAATMVRNGITKLIRKSELDVTLLGIMPRELLIELFKPENREYLYSLVRIKGLKIEDAYEFPNSLDILFPADADAKEAEHTQLLADLRKTLQEIEAGLDVREERDARNDVSIIKVFKGADDILHYKYAVRNGISNTAGANNRFVKKPAVVFAMPDKTDAIIQAVENYVGKYNSAEKLAAPAPATPAAPAQEKPKDQAMMADIVGTQSPDPVGGIDFNDIELEMLGSQMNLQFNPEAMQYLLQSGVEGFTPVIINIVPIPSILPILGLESGKEAELQISSAK